MDETIKLYASDKKQTDYHPFVQGYIDAYIRLRGSLGSHTLEYQYYPLIYILMHVLELTLKHLNYIWSLYDPQVQKKSTHDLNHLWDQKVKNIFYKFQTTITKNDFKLIETLVQEFKVFKKYEQLSCSRAKAV